MESVIAIISVISGSASVGGLICEFYGKTDRVKSYLKVMFGAVFLFSLYILFIPGNTVIDNVSDKIRYYSKEVSDDTLIQEGTFSYSGRGPFSIKFNEPYKERPKVLIINENGYEELEIPIVEMISNHYFDVKRYGSAGMEFTPRFLQTYRWVAEGKPFMNKDK